MTRLNLGLLSSQVSDVFPGIAEPYFEEHPLTLLGTLIQKSAEEVRGCKRFGRVKYKRIHEALKAKGLDFGMQLPKGVYEIGRIDMREVSRQLAVAAQQRDDIVYIKFDVPLVRPDPIYGNSLCVHFDMQHLFTTNEDWKVMHEFKRGGTWRKATVNYNHFVVERGFVKIHNE